MYILTTSSVRKRVLAIANKISHSPRPKGVVWNILERQGRWTMANKMLRDRKMVPVNILLLSGGRTNRER